MQGSSRFTGINDGGYLGKQVEVTPMGLLRVSEQVRLVGATFSGNLVTPDARFWTPSIAGTGTVTQPYGQLALTTAGGGAGSAIVQSFRNARYIGGTSCVYRAQIQHDVVPVANRTARWGAFTVDNGAFFEWTGATVNVVTRRNAGAVVDTPVAQAAWNGQAVTGNPFTYNAADTLVHIYEIYWTNGAVWFVIDDKLVHKVSASAAPWSSDMNLPVRAENVTTAGIASNLYCRVMSISRLGTPLTRPIYAHANVNGAAIVVLKNGPGTFHGMTLNTVGPAGNSLTIYDDVVIAPANVLAVYNTNNANLSASNFPHGVDFYRGFGYVLNGGVSAADVTLVFE